MRAVHAPHALLLLTRMEQKNTHKHPYTNPTANKTKNDNKKVVRELDARCALASLHSTSKGFVGECGRRGGYMEVVNFPRQIHEMILKLASINLCPNVSGQICCTLMMTPPQPGDPSHEQVCVCAFCVRVMRARDRVASGRILGDGRSSYYMSLAHNTPSRPLPP
jgi:aspartate/methionine/tyrosine aminotransferase